MKINDLMTFSPHSRERETLPALAISVLGRPIEFADQIGTMRLLKGDHVGIQELRGDHALVSHAALKGGLLLISNSQLTPIPADPATTREEDAAL